MKPIGGIRIVDELGRVTIPAEIRRTMGFETGAPVEFFQDGGRVFFQTHETCCALCYSREDVKPHKTGKHICGSCLEV